MLTALAWVTVPGGAVMIVMLVVWAVRRATGRTEYP